MPAIRAVVFDLDDTLFAERQFAFSGFAAVADSFATLLGDPARSADEMRDLYDSAHRPRVFDEMLNRRRHAIEAATVKRMVDVYHAHVPELSLFPDAERALTRLRASYRLGLITDGPSRMQAAKVDALELRQLMDDVILTDELGPGAGKPSLIAYENMANLLEVKHGECVYVGDNASKDFVAPNALGWMSVQIIRPGGVYGAKVPPPGGKPRHTIASLDDLDALMK